MRIAAVAVSLALVSLPAEGGDRHPRAEDTVRVDCGRNQSINRALERHPQVENLTVEIEGICTENVVITRDRVTLRGADPSTDGIRAASDATQIDAAVWIRGAHQVTLENLKLTGGYAGLLATEVSTLWARAVNCRFEGNRAYGALLETALLQVEDGVLTDNGSVNAGVFQASRLECRRCTLSNPLLTGPILTRNNVLALAGSTAILIESTLTEGGLNLSNAVATITDSTIEARLPGPGIALPLQSLDSNVTLTRSEVAGALSILQGSTVRLFGVVQTRSDGGNVADDDSFVRVADASPAAGGPPSIPSSIMGLTLRNFSNASLLQTSQLTTVSCSLGSNAFCANPANVSGSSTCALCPVP
jgi:hypothetical protein